MTSTSNEVAIVVGVGAGLGRALAERFVREGCAVAAAARSYDRVKDITDQLEGEARAYECDATEEVDVRRLFEKVSHDLGDPTLVVYNAGAFVRRSILETAADDFEHAWRANCFGGFLVGREAARIMVKRDTGTILFTGATASRRGSAGFANLAVGKFGLRALAQSMARELNPQGVHVAHVIIDGMIHNERNARLAVDDAPEDAMLAPDAIAEAYWQLHRQHRSAWSLEVDLRPWVERF